MHKIQFVPDKPHESKLIQSLAASIEQSTAIIESTSGPILSCPHLSLMITTSTQHRERGLYLSYPMDGQSATQSSHSAIRVRACVRVCMSVCVCMLAQNPSSMIFTKYGSMCNSNSQLLCERRIAKSTVICSICMCTSTTHSNSAGTCILMTVLMCVAYGYCVELSQRQRSCTQLIHW